MDATQSLRSPLFRLAVAYAPRPLRARYVTLFALDEALALVVDRRTEPMLAQIRLAWWREQLERGAAPATDTVACIRDAWSGDLGGLLPIVDGWEALLAEEPDVAAAASERAKPFVAIARHLGGGEIAADRTALAARRWALVDLAGRLRDPAPREAALRLAHDLPATLPPLPRALRPLAILEGLAWRSLRRGGGSLLGDRLSPFAALRIGLFGR